MESTLSPPAALTYQCETGDYECCSGTVQPDDSPGQSIRCVHSCHQVRNQDQKHMINVTAHLRSGIHTVDNGRTPVGRIQMRAGVLNRELHVYVPRSTGTVAQRGEESNSGIRAAAPPEAQGTAGCIVPASLPGNTTTNRGIFTDCPKRLSSRSETFYAFRLRTVATERTRIEA
jgi:hypothetical protein